MRRPYSLPLSSLLFWTMNAAPVNFNVGDQNNGMSQPLLSAQQPTAIPVQATPVPANQPTPAPVNAIPTAIPQAAPMYPQPGMPVPAQPVMPVPGQPMMPVPGQPVMPVPGQPVMPPAQPMNLDYLMQCSCRCAALGRSQWRAYCGEHQPVGGVHGLQRHP